MDTMKHHETQPIKRENQQPATPTTHGMTQLRQESHARRLEVGQSGDGHLFDAGLGIFGHHGGWAPGRRWRPSAAQSLAQTHLL